MKTTLPFTWFPPFLFQSLLSLLPFVVVVVNFFCFFVLFLTNLPTQFLEKEVLFGEEMCVFLSVIIFFISS